MIVLETLPFGCHRRILSRLTFTSVQRPYLQQPDKWTIDPTLNGPIFGVQLREFRLFLGVPGYGYSDKIVDPVIPRIACQQKGFSFSHFSPPKGKTR